MTALLPTSEARAVLARHARTFRGASFFLPAATRDDAAVVYAFCRTVDDVVDEGDDPLAIDALREELNGDRPAGPVVGAFLAVAERRRIPLSAARELIDGCASDWGRVRVADEGELLRYAYLVAGTVGRMMAPLLGASHSAADRHAVELGLAMQLTNIARDVAEDAKRDRVYLPATWLAERDVVQDDVARQTADRQATFAVVERLVLAADVHYRRGEAGLRYLPLRTRVAIGVASRVYRAIGLRVVRRGMAALEDRTVLTTSERIRRTIEGILAPWFQLGGKPA